MDARLQRLDRQPERLNLSREAVRRMAEGVEPEEAMQAVSARVASDQPRIAGMLKATAECLLRSLRLAPATPKTDTPDVGRTMFGRDLGHHLFGAGDVIDQHLTEDMYRLFLRRVVAVEIIRRSFTDDDLVHNAQQLTFAQLTPEAPTPILSPLPLNRELFSTPSVKDKLCGAIVGHFGAFYRRSWRANDFLWGRMDAAARIVQMLVGAQRTQDVHRDYENDDPPWKTIANALVCGGPCQRALVAEALGSSRWMPDRELLAKLEKVLKDDLTGPPNKPGVGDVTRILCTRAVQFEILQQELQCVATEAARDHKPLGSTPATLPFDGLD